jgi:N-methylhydantoinase A
VTASVVATAVATFNRLHECIYGHVSDHGAAEFVNLRMTHTHAIDRDPRRPEPTAPRMITPAPMRRCYFRDLGGMVDTAIHARAAVVPGAIVRGPAVIHQLDTTTVVGPGWSCRADAHGNLLLQAD